MDANLRNHFNNLQGAALQDLNKAKTEGIGILRQQVDVLNVAVANLNSDLDKKQAELNEALDEADFFRNLLSKPMSEIAVEHGGFRETYQKQQELMAEWMVSQKAFKELAIKLGEQLGMSKEDVIQQGVNGKMDVLNNQNNPEHNTNASDSPIIENQAEKLKVKIRNKK